MSRKYVMKRVTKSGPVAVFLGSVIGLVITLGACKEVNYASMRAIDAVRISNTNVCLITYTRTRGAAMIRVPCSDLEGIVLRELK